MFPAVQGKPMELLNYLAGELIDKKTNGVLVILTRKDGTIDLRCFGRSHRRDMIVAMMKFQEELLKQED